MKFYYIIIPPTHFILWCCWLFFFILAASLPWPFLVGILTCSSNAIISARLYWMQPGCTWLQKIPWDGPPYKCSAPLSCDPHWHALRPWRCTFLHSSTPAMGFCFFLKRCLKLSYWNGTWDCISCQRLLDNKKNRALISIKFFSPCRESISGPLVWPYHTSLYNCIPSNESVEFFIFI